VIDSARGAQTTIAHRERAQLPIDDGCTEHFPDTTARAMLELPIM
jgi:hypothetical protein